MFQLLLSATEVLRDRPRKIRPVDRSMECNLLHNIGPHDRSGYHYVNGGQWWTLWIVPKRHPARAGTGSLKDCKLLDVGSHVPVPILARFPLLRPFVPYWDEFGESAHRQGYYDCGNAIYLPWTRA